MPGSRRQVQCKTASADPLWAKGYRGPQEDGLTQSMARCPAPRHNRRMRPLLPTLRPSLAARLVVVRLAMAVLLAAAIVPGISRLLAPADLFSEAPCHPAVHAAMHHGAPMPAGHEHGDACAMCTLAHTTPTLAGVPPVDVTVVAFAPPAPPSAEPVRTRAAQARAPSARAPPAARCIAAA